MEVGPFDVAGRLTVMARTSSSVGGTLTDKAALERGAYLLRTLPGQIHDLKIALAESVLKGQQTSGQ